jgi:hypothetical protein
MGYACPVCDDPQQDAGHLANHIAFTAMLGDGAHEAWLDEHAPGWEEEGEAELADRVADHAEEREFPQVFEDTTGHDHEGEGHHADRDDLPPGAEGVDAPTDEAAREVLAEARELTERMRADDGNWDEDDAADG